MKRVIIIGGGAAGLGAAYKVNRAASEGHDVEFVLVEKDRRLGCKIQTESRVATANDHNVVHHWVLL